MNLVYTFKQNNIYMVTKKCNVAIYYTMLKKYTTKIQLLLKLTLKHFFFFKSLNWIFLFVLYLLTFIVCEFTAKQNNKSGKKENVPAVKGRIECSQQCISFKFY